MFRLIMICDLETDFQLTEISTEGKINVNVKCGHFSSCTDIQTQPFCHFFSMLLKWQHVGVARRHKKYIDV